MKQTLQEIFNEIGNLTETDYGGNDKGGKIHTYLETYDRLFQPFQKGCTMLEIGLAMGDSIKLWDQYFENSTIIGMDISVVFQPEQYKNIVEIIEVDATSPKMLDYIDDNSLQIVVEDASHMEADSIKIFNLLKPKMAKGGLYFVEDVLNLNMSKSRFEKIHDNIEIFDMRYINNRFDNVLILFRF
jgi:hypothetical protein